MLPALQSAVRQGIRLHIHFRALPPAIASCQYSTAARSCRILADLWPAEAPALSQALYSNGCVPYALFCSVLQQPRKELIWEGHHHPDHVLQSTKSWMQFMVAGQGLCPFIRNAEHGGMPEGELLYQVSQTDSVESAGVEFWKMAAQLAEASTDTAASMLILPQFTADLVRFALFASDLGLRLRTSIKQQLMCIPTHPMWEMTDPADFRILPDSQLLKYTRRSPFPMLTVTKRTDLMRGLQLILAPTGLAQSHRTSNMRKLQAIGQERLQAMLDAKDWSGLPPSNRSSAH